MKKKKKYWLMHGMGTRRERTNREFVSGVMGRRFAGGERSDATLHPPGNCTSPLLCCYGDAFRLSAPITAASLAFSPFSTFFALKIGQREHFWNSFLNLSDWRSDLDGDWVLSLSNIVFSCGESASNAALTHMFPHVASKPPIPLSLPLKNVVCERLARWMAWL